MDAPIKRAFLPRLSALVAAAALLYGGPAMALNLTQAYQMALQNDPVYRSAFYDKEGGKEYAILGRSALLPTLQGSFSTSKNHADTTAFDTTGHGSETKPVYFSRVGQVELRQPLFSLDAWARYKEGKAQTKYSELVFSGQVEDLMLRLVAAYTDALNMDEQLALAQVQRDTYAEQRLVNDRLFQKGEGTVTDSLETQSRLDLAEAQLIEARDNQANARATLAGIVGGDVQGLAGLSPNFHTLPLQPAGFEAWKELALANNADILAQRASIEAAEQEVKKNRAGHAPKLDFVASVAKNDAVTVDTYNQNSNVGSIGIQLTVPLYAGGSVSAATRQAVAGREKAKSDLQAKTDKALIDLRKQYNLVLSSASRIEALEKAVVSGKLLMTATTQSIKGGVRINLDLLNAQQQLYTSQRDLAQARYTYLLATLRLRGDAGTLTADDLRQVAAWFD